MIFKKEKCFMRQRIEIDVWTLYSPCFSDFTAPPINASISPRALLLPLLRAGKGNS